jgi:large subunit ribosomal protein L4
MELNLINERGQQQAKVEASDALFGRDYSEGLVHQLVTAFLANARSGNRAQKDRGEVKHSTRKPWRQKGTGRARAGMASSPLWRGGGRIFPNRPDENFSQKINRKMYRAGISVILSQLAREGRLSVIEEMKVEAPRTRLLARKLKDMGMDKVLIVADRVDDNLWLSARNLPHVLVVEPHEADPVCLVHYDRVLMTRDAVRKFEEMWA